MGLIIDGKDVEVPGVTVVSWKDDARVKLSKEDGTFRKAKQAKCVILHTILGIPGGQDKRPQVIIPGSGTNLDRVVKTAQFWSGDPRQSGTHILVGEDGTVYQTADLLTMCTFHAGQRQINENSIGIELAQRQSDAGIYMSTLEACVKLCNFLGDYFGIQKQVHYPYLKKPVERLSSGGRDCVGFFGHRDVSNNRGEGDPGNAIMELLIKNGFEKFNLQKNEDLEAWEKRQQDLNLVSDGVPGPNTVKSLKTEGYINGIWVNGKQSGKATTPLTEYDRSFLEKVFEFLKKLLGK